VKNEKWKVQIEEALSHFAFFTSHFSFFILHSGMLPQGTIPPAEAQVA
jgi:hypothetical protein